AQNAFWQRVNESGGIGGFDVNVSEYTKDNKYNPEVHNQVYQEIKPHVLGLAQTLGSPTTAAIIDDLRANNIVSAPASWTSLWAHEDVIIESGNNYCTESMNALDWASGQTDVSTVMAVAYPGDYGGDAAAGAKIYAEENGLEFTYVEQIPLGLGGTTQGAVAQIVQQDPDVVVVTTAPSELAEIVGGAAAQGYQGMFLGTSPTWNPALLQSPAADALVALYHQSGPWQTFTSDTPGHQAMRETLGDVTPNDGYTSGWIWSYPTKAALEKAVEMGDLTREGLLAAVKSLESVDFEGTLPEGAGNYAGDVNAQVVRQSVISKPDPESPTGVTEVQGFFTSDTAESYDFSAGACYQVVSLN
ncbi:MAG: ABC transporter substrate-binding protein, partial [Nitriliruptorales bacterium]